MGTIAEGESSCDFPIFYRFAPEFRRSGIYLLAGSLLLATTATGLQQLGFGPGWDRTIGVIALLTAPMLGCALLVFRQLLRVDDRGIWRRRFWRWDLWPWEAFSGGQIKQGTSLDSFIYPLKPWWHRFLTLEFLEDHDRKHLAALIKRVWIPPQLPGLPEELTIRWGFRRRARLIADGIEIGKGKHGEGLFYSWADVSQVRITRLDHERRDFREVEIVLPDPARPIVLRFHEGRPLWSGAESDVVAAFLERVVTTERLLITSATGSPRTLAEADWRLAALDRVDREIKQARWFVGSMLLVAFGGLLFVILGGGNPNPRPRDFVSWFALGVMCFQFGFVVWFGRYVLSKRTLEATASRAKLVGWREQLTRLTS